MRFILSLFLVILFSVNALASFQSVEEVAKWATYYYKNPDPMKIPEALLYMSRSGEIKNDSDIIPLAGFLAGVLKDNPDRAASLIERLSYLPSKHKGILISGIWYSERPDAKKIVLSIIEQDNILKNEHENNKYLKGSPPSITEIPLEQGPWVLDILWGNFLATGSSRPVVRIITALSYFKRDKNYLYAIGAAAKWSLISNAKQHESVLKICIEQSEKQPKEISDELKEIIKLVKAKWFK